MLAVRHEAKPIAGTTLRLALVVAALAVCWSINEAAAQSPNDVKNDFALVEKIGTQKAYEIFLRTHPTGPYADIARTRLGALPAAEKPVRQRFQPNWGDDIFIPRLIEKQK